MVFLSRHWIAVVSDGDSASLIFLSHHRVASVNHTDSTSLIFLSHHRVASVNHTDSTSLIFLSHHRVASVNHTDSTSLIFLSHHRVANVSDSAPLMFLSCCVVELASINPTMGSMDAEMKIPLNWESRAVRRFSRPGYSCLAWAADRSLAFLIWSTLHVNSTSFYPNTPPL